tara:strand:+ start:555 stop:2216 length:1662 start_codon:yes stop_codon:yes gene_type:complete
MILTKSDYLAKINGLLPDNSTQQISPEDLRESLTDLVDSVHLFLDGKEINTANFSSPDYRTTLGGDLALEKINLVNRLSIDNTAFGYYALGANYVSSGNTALGSYALGCNLDGTHNVAVGLNALGGNVKGSGNVGIGNFSLLTNKHGSYNIAIGHGAGHYAHSGINSDTNSFQFFLGAYPGFEQDHTCDIVDSSGARPLLYGKLDDLLLGVAVPSTHNDGGTLQVSGDITPFTSGESNLGTSKYAFNSVNEVVYFSGGKVGLNTDAPSGDYGVMTSKGHIVPHEDAKWSLGNKVLRWDGWFNDLVVSGQLHANDVNYNHINECLYDCKTLHLATSGFCDPDDMGFHNDTLCGYLSDEGIDGGGFEIHSSGSDYQRNYSFLFRYPDPSTKCIDPIVKGGPDELYARARWQSNISIQLESGRHVQADRILGGRDKLSLVKSSGCFGLLLRTDFNTEKSILDFGPEEIIESGYCNKDFNFLSASGDFQLPDGNISGHDISVMYGSIDSGVKVTQQFSSRIKNCNTLRGFRWVYHDEIDSKASGCDDSGSPRHNPLA